PRGRRVRRQRLRARPARAARQDHAGGGGGPAGALVHAAAPPRQARRRPAPAAARQAGTSAQAVASGERERARRGVTHPIVIAVEPRGEGVPAQAPDLEGVAVVAQLLAPVPARGVEAGRVVLAAEAAVAPAGDGERIGARGRAVAEEAAHFEREAVIDVALLVEELAPVALRT